MTAKKQEQSASFRLIACAALAISPLLGASSMAADNHFHVGAFASPAPAFDGETRIPAARPAASGPAQSGYASSSDGMAENGETTGRLRLRPMNLGGL